LPAPVPHVIITPTHHVAACLAVRNQTDPHRRSCFRRIAGSGLCRIRAEKRESEREWRPIHIPQAAFHRMRSDELFYIGYSIRSKLKTVPPKNLKRIFPTWGECDGADPCLRCPWREFCLDLLDVLRSQAGLRVELTSHACARCEVIRASSDRQSARSAQRSGLGVIGLNAESKCSAAEGGAILSL
jgi:hypothetical protein